MRYHRSQTLCLIIFHVSKRKQNAAFFFCADKTITLHITPFLIVISPLTNVLTKMHPSLYRFYLREVVLNIFCLFVLSLHRMPTTTPPTRRAQIQRQRDSNAVIARAIEDAQRERIEADRIREVELATFAAIDAEDTRKKDADRAMFESVVNASQQLRVHGLILKYVSAVGDDCLYRALSLSLKSQHRFDIVGLNRQAIARELSKTDSPNRHEYLRMHTELAKTPGTYNYGKTLAGFARFHGEGHGESNELVVAAASNIIEAATQLWYACA